MFDGGRDALRDRWDASERDSELLRLAAGDDLGDDNGAKRFDAAAACHFSSHLATSQGSGRCGSATLPASGGELEVFYALIAFCKYR